MKTLLSFILLLITLGVNATTIVGDQFTGSHVGNGSGLTNVNASNWNGLTNSIVQVPLTANNTNQLLTEYAGVGFLNTSWTWNPAFIIAGHMNGAYTNANRQLAFYDPNAGDLPNGGQAALPSWLMASNSPNLLADLQNTGTNVWFWSQANMAPLGGWQPNNPAGGQVNPGNPPIAFYGLTTNASVANYVSTISMPPQMNVYYILPQAPNASDSGTLGTLGSPWLSFTNVGIMENSYPGLPPSTFFCGPGTIPNLQNVAITNDSVIGSGKGVTFYNGLFTPNGNLTVSGMTLPQAIFSQIANTNGQTTIIEDVQTGLTGQPLLTSNIDGIYAGYIDGNLIVNNSAFYSTWDTIQQMESTTNSSLHFNNCIFWSQPSSTNDLAHGPIAWGQGLTSVSTVGGTWYFNGGQVVISNSFAARVSSTYGNTNSFFAAVYGAHIHIKGVNCVNLGCSNNFIPYVVVGTGSSIELDDIPGMQLILTNIGGAGIWMTNYDNSTPITLSSSYNGTFTGNGGGLTNVVGIQGIVYTNLVKCTTGTNAIHYTVPAGMTNGYTVTGFVTVTALSLDVAQPKILWTDENGTAQSQSLGTSISATGWNNLPYTFIRAKGGTTIDVTNALTTGTGSLTYDVSAHLIPMDSNQ